MKMNGWLNIALVIVSCFGLAGCAIKEKIEARNDMQQSKAAYKTCLLNNPEKPQACEGYKKIYEADMKDFTALDAAMTGHTVSVMAP